MLCVCVCVCVCVCAREVMRERESIEIGLESTKKPYCPIQ